MPNKIQPKQNNIAGRLLVAVGIVFLLGGLVGYSVVKNNLLQKLVLVEPAESHEEDEEPNLIGVFDPNKPAPVLMADDLPCFDISLSNPYANANPKDCGGILGPLIPTHTTNVHSGLIWKKEAETPKLLSWFRHPEFRASDVVDPNVLENLISGTGLLPLGVTSSSINPSTGLNEGALRDPRSNFQGAVRQSYAWNIYGGFSIVGHGRSVARRLHTDRGIENTQLWDLSAPDAFKNAGKFDVAKLTDKDAQLNLAAFQDAGFSKGLRTNIYCPGHVTIGDGRVVVMGGNDMNSNNGQYKVNIFDPETETWSPRTPPCTRALWANASTNDPFLTNAFAPLYGAFFNDPASSTTKNALYLGAASGCDPINGGAKVSTTTEMGFPFIRYLGPTATNPSDQSDMKYARWYPTALALPDDTVLVISGVDQNESLGTSQPLKTDSTTGKKELDLDPVSGYPRAALADTEFRASKIFQAVPERYDPKKDRTAAMENARLLMPLYPHAFPVQTGPKKDDWQVAMFPGELLSKLGGNQKFAGFYKGKTWLLDVRGALKDPNREVPGENHLTFVGSATVDHASYFGTAELVEIGPKGKLLSHKVAAFGGQSPDPVTGTNTINNVVEMIDFASATPKWQLQGPLYQPARGTKVTPLADGTVIIAGGSDAPGDTLETSKSLNFQLYNPADGTTTKLRIKTTVPRSIHGDIFLMPDATVMLTGDDHTNAVIAGDRVAPLGDPDLGVDTAQIFKPAYLFNADGTEADRPVILQAPQKIQLGVDFEIKVDKGNEIKMVTLVRTGMPTHSQYANIRHIKLAFQDKGEGALKVVSPENGAHLVPGDYMLFVINTSGVPSIAKHLRATTDLEGVEVENTTK